MSQQQVTISQLNWPKLEGWLLPHWEPEWYSTDTSCVHILTLTIFGKGAFEEVIKLK